MSHPVLTASLLILGVALWPAKGSANGPPEDAAFPCRNSALSAGEVCNEGERCRCWLHDHPACPESVPPAPCPVCLYPDGSDCQHPYYNPGCGGAPATGAAAGGLALTLLLVRRRRGTSVEASKG